MLVLSRKVNESIMIGNEIVVTLTQIQGNKVRIGIQAPDHVRIMRSELLIEKPEADTPDESVFA